MEMTVTKWDESMITRCLGVLPGNRATETAVHDSVRILKPLKKNPEVKASPKEGPKYPARITNITLDEWSDFRDSIDWAAF